MLKIWMKLEVATHILTVRAELTPTTLPVQPDEIGALIKTLEPEILRLLLAASSDQGPSKQSTPTVTVAPLGHFDLGDCSPDTYSDQPHLMVLARSDIDIRVEPRGDEAYLKIRERSPGSPWLVNTFLAHDEVASVRSSPAGCTCRLNAISAQYLARAGYRLV